MQNVSNIFYQFTVFCRYFLFSSFSLFSFIFNLPTSDDFFSPSLCMVYFVWLIKILKSSSSELLITQNTISHLFQSKNALRSVSISTWVIYSWSCHVQDFSDFSNSSKAQCVGVISFLCCLRFSSHGDPCWGHLHSVWVDWLGKWRLQENTEHCKSA